MQLRAGEPPAALARISDRMLLRISPLVLHAPRSLPRSCTPAAVAAVAGRSRAVLAGAARSPIRFVRSSHVAARSLPSVSSADPRRLVAALCSPLAANHRTGRLTGRSRIAGACIAAHPAASPRIDAHPVARISVRRMSVPAAASTEAASHNAGGAAAKLLSLPPPLSFFAAPSESRLAELTGPSASSRPPTLNEFLAAAKRSVQQSPAELAAAVEASTVRGTSGEKISVLKVVVVIGQSRLRAASGGQLAIDRCAAVRVDSFEHSQSRGGRRESLSSSERAGDQRGASESLLLIPLSRVVLCCPPSRCVCCAQGNEASDMDSMVSSIVLAWYLSCIYPFHQTAHYFLPLMNIPREELALRGEASYVFAQVGLDPSLLLFKDEIDLGALGRRVSLGAILVDHNNLQLEMSPHLAAHVVGIVDHHHDEGLYPLSFERGNRIIVTPVGSCTTLVGDLILRRAPGLLSKDAISLSDSQRLSMSTPLAILTLLQSVLLLDTSNFSASAKKATKLDTTLAEKYRTLLQDLTYYELHTRRNDVSHLSTRHMLVKDTKYGESQRYPYFIASLPGSLADWAKRDPQILPHIEAFAREKGVRFIVVMNAFSNPQTKSYNRTISLFVLADHLGLESKTAEEVAAVKQGELMAHDPFVTSAPNVHVDVPPGSSAVGPPLGSQDLAQALVDSLVKDPKARESLDVAEDDSLLPGEARAQKHRLIIHTFQQKNVAGSRKQVAPIVEALTSKL